MIRYGHVIRSIMYMKVIWSRDTIYTYFIVETEVCRRSDDPCFVTIHSSFDISMSLLSLEIKVLHEL